ncbi:MAG: aldehyde dehydrogenase family protein [Acidimicrobiia bacterium]
MQQTYGLFVDGEEIKQPKGRYYEDRDPANGEVLAEVAQGDADDVDHAVASAVSAFPGWRDTTAAERGRVMVEIARRIRQEAAELAHLETLDMGQTVRHSRSDIETAARYFEFYGGGADKLHGDVIPLGPKYLSYTRHDPFGVVGFVLPWNAPINQFARGVAPCLAVGNAAVVKPAEDTPLSALELARIAVECGLPAGVLNIVPGAGAEVGTPIAKHPDVRKVAFTGSVATGKVIMRLAAERLIPLTLELGGKSPNIVFEDADLDAAAASAWTAFTFKTGQVCSAGSRLLVQDSVYDEMVERMVAKAESATVAPGIEDPDLGSLANASQYDKVREYMAIGEAEGATLATGGRIPDEERLRRGYFVQPTVFTEVDNNMRIAQEEIFGPVLSMIRFSDEADALEKANGTDFGLVAGVWSRDVGLVNRMAALLDAGQVFINEWFAGGVETPFGGFKSSGFGREKGFDALAEYSQVKTVTARIS